MRVAPRLLVVFGLLAGSAAAPAQEKSVFLPLDLTAFFTEPVSKTSTDKQWKQVPRGAQTLAGVPFTISGRLEVTGLDAARHGDFRNARVDGIPIGKKFARLHLLHGAAHGGKDGVPMSTLVLHYAGDETRSFRVAYGVHARNWIRASSERQSRPEDPNSVIAWSQNEEAESSTSTLRFYKTTFDNPLPDREIVSMDVVSLFSKATPIIFALTLEQGPKSPPAPASGRKAVGKAGAYDDSVYVREIALQVTEAGTTTPLTNALAQLSITDDDSTFFFGEAFTDARGVLRLSFPAQQTLALRLLVKAPGHASEVITAAARDPKAFPRDLNVALARGAKIGGVVRNESGQPFSGADVLISRLIKTGESDFTRLIYDYVSTDSSGRWSTDRAPQKLDEVSFKISSSDCKPVTYETAVPGATNLFQVAASNLLAGQAVMTVQSRVRVTGWVVDAKGGALGGAEVALYTDAYGRRRVTSDAQGGFTFVPGETGRAYMTVLATNFAPAYQTLEIESGLKPLVFTLGRGIPFKARVRDQDGAPVAGASVTLDQWNNIRSDSWRTQTDSEGRFTWPNAPVGGVGFSLSKNNYYETRLLAGIPTNGESMVIMRKYSRVYASVIDAKTKEAIDVVSVTKGHRNQPEEPLRWNRGYTEKFKRGRFSMPFSEYSGGETRLLMEAPGYWPLLSSPITQAGIYTNQYELQPGRGPVGTVQYADGTPAGKASVVLADAAVELRLDSDYGSPFYRHSASGEFASTEYDGSFEITPRLEARTIYAASSGGYGVAGVDEVKTAGKIILQPWGRVRGSVRIGDQPARPPAEGSQPYQWVVLHNLEHDYADTGHTNLSVLLRTRMDTKGNFAFDRVPPGEWQVSLQYRFSRYELARAPLILSHGVPVVVKSGVTNDLMLGGGGVSVVGKMDAGGLDSTEIDWRRDAHTLVLQVPGVPDFTTDFSRAKSEPERQKMVTESIIRQKIFWSSDKGRAAVRAQRTYALLFESNGVFHADNVLPGTYQLTVAPTELLYDRDGTERYTNGLAGFASRKVVVRESKAGEPLDLGVIKLETRPIPRLGKSAPSFTAKGAYGRAVKPEDFRGKFLLLDFWTTWTEGRGTDLKVLKALAGSDPNRLAILSVNLDQDQRTADAYVSFNEFNWPQSYLGPWSESKIPATFGADEPGLILLDPQGRLASKLLRGEAIRTAVTKALPVPMPLPDLLPPKAP